MLVEVRVQSLGLDRSSENPVVILQEIGGTRVLPIWIGLGEASAIAMQLADMTFSRPLTHDLLVSVLKGLGGELKQVIIGRVEDNTYFAELLIRRGADLVTVDARPSDCIAVALRMNAGIHAEESLLEELSIEIAQDEAILDPSDLPLRKEKSSGRMNPEELKEHLRKLNPEDFGRFTP